MEQTYKPSEKVLNLLKTKYNIEIKDYWNLNEEQKQEITDIIQVYYDEILARHPQYFGVYLDLMKNSLRRSEYFEDFEVSDMLKRSIKKFKDLYYGDIEDEEFYEFD